jgi:hypothetical protein
MPRLEMLAPPSDVTSPPKVADVEVMLVSVGEVTVGAVVVVSTVPPLPPDTKLSELRYKAGQTEYVELGPKVFVELVYVQ